MRRKLLAMTAVLAVFGICGGLAIAAESANGKEYIGTWNGTWEGGGAGGRFDLTLAVGADGKLTGGVSVGQDTGDYTAQFVAVSIEGNKLTARYSFPPDEQADIKTTATFDGKTAKGVWELVPKGQDTAMAAGTWTVTKK
jgi:hypothetical protein